MRRVVSTTLALAGALTMLLVSGLAASPDDRAELLKVREAVWRAWFANDTKSLTASVPPDTIVISSGEEKWKNQADILQSAAKFQAAGGRLIRLEFPRTEIQRYGNTAIIYTSYELEVEQGGRRRAERGTATEMFVRKGPQWLNTGWQLAPAPPAGR